MNNELLKQICDEFWHNAFKEGKRCKIIKDGHYHIETDKDLLAIYCGCIFQ